MHRKSTHIAGLRSLRNELNTGRQAKKEPQFPELMLLCKILHILPGEFETFRSNWILLTKDDVRTFDVLTVQLCMFERNFTRSVWINELEHDALTARSHLRNETNKSYKSRRNDICKYCKKKGHWVRDCRKWM